MGQSVNIVFDNNHESSMVKIESLSRPGQNAVVTSENGTQKLV